MFNEWIEIHKTIKERFLWKLTKCFTVGTSWTNITIGSSPVGLIHSWWTARLVPTSNLTEMARAAGIVGGLWYILALRAIVPSITITIWQGKSKILTVFTRSTKHAEGIIGVSSTIWRLVKECKNEHRFQKFYTPFLYNDKFLRPCMLKDLLENVPGEQGICAVVPSGQ